jgi:hypothetical protein
MITVDTTSGDEGLIYDGEVEYEVHISCAPGTRLGVVVTNLDCVCVWCV